MGDKSGIGQREKFEREDTQELLNTGTKKMGGSIRRCNSAMRSDLTGCDENWELAQASRAEAESQLGGENDIIVQGFGSGFVSRPLGICRL